MTLGSPLPRGARALAFLCALAAGSPARADEPRPAAPAPAPADTVELDEVLVRVPRAQAPEAPTAAATVVEADRFLGEAKGVAELLSVSPGVDVTRYGAAGQRATVSIRGVAATGVKVLVDGLPLGDASGGVDLTTLPRTWISRVEVIRGPASGAAFGAGALGGAVNVVTREAGAGPAAELAAGSLGTRAASVEGSTRAGGLTAFAAATAETVGGEFDYRFRERSNLAGTAVETRTRENDGSRRAGLLLKVGGPAGGLRLDAMAQLSGGLRELPGSPRQPTPGDWQRDGRALGTARLSGTALPGLTLAVRVHGRADLLDTRLAALGAAAARQRGGAGGVAAEAALAHGPGLLSASLSAELERYAGDALGASRSRPTLAAALAEDLLVLGGRLRLGPALRVERAGPFSGASAGAGAVLRLAGDLSLRASGGRSWRVPSFAELYLQQGLLAPNPDLRPERATGGDAALVYDGPLGLASAGGFAGVHDDVISYEPASLSRFKPFNTARALLAGAEAELATAPVARLLGLSLSGAYTFLHSEILRGTTYLLGKALPRRPRHQLLARAAIAPGWFTAHVEARLVRHQFQDRLNEQRVPDQTVLSAGAGVRLCDGRVSLHAEVENLGDDRTLTDGFGYPLPGRTVMFTVRLGPPRKESP